MQRAAFSRTQTERSAAAIAAALVAAVLWLNDRRRHARI